MPTPARGALPWLDVAADFAVVLDELNTTLKSIEAVLRIDDMRNEIADLEQQAAAPDLWNDVEAAQAITSKLSYLQGDLRRVEELRSRLDDVALMHEMAAEEGDEATTAETERELVSIRTAIEELEVRTLLSGEYDSREALVTIRSEAGGVDAADFAEMLMRMYLRWAERHKYPVELYDVSYAEEAGIKSATFAVKQPYAYGTLSVEQGTHRLVRISPFDNQGRRQTSFAGVEVLPVVEQTDHVDIPENEIRVDVFRSCRPGCWSSGRPSSGPRWTRSRARAAAGATRCAPTSCTRTRWSRTCGRSRRRATPRPSSTVTSTPSSRPASGGAVSRSRCPPADSLGSIA